MSRTSQTIQTVSTINAACLAACVSFCLGGCTAENAYRTVQAAAKKNCLRQPPSAQKSCEERLIKEDYATYEKTRAQK